MREVACFLSPFLFKANYPAFVNGLRKNGIDVKSYDISKHSSGYTQQVKEHNRRLAEREGCFCQQQSQPRDHNEPSHAAATPFERNDYNFLCIAFEDSRQGVRAARAAGMCVVGIGCNQIERDRLRAQ